MEFNELKMLESCKSENTAAIRLWFSNIIQLLLYDTIQHKCSTFYIDIY